jgi:Fe-S oxidoreductase
MYALWSIFPLRLLAESFTAHLSGGSFLILPANWIIRQLFGNDPNAIFFWWAYSIALAVFFFVLPFSRYMHIPAEMFLIPLRNAGIKLSNARRGFAKVQVLSCPNCGVCIDACPMSADKANIKDATVYLTRQLRCGNEQRIAEISDKCLLCGKCNTVCQVGVDGAELRVHVRSEREYNISPDYSNVNAQSLINPGGSVLYYSGCMSKLVPSIGRSMESIFQKANVDYNWIDREGGMCCGRPMYMTGRVKEANRIVQKNEEAILSHGAKTLVVSCAICYRMFMEKYNIPGVRVIHYIQYIEELLSSEKIKLDRSDICYVYHDPCELGRGCGIYEEPRLLLGKIAGIAEAEKNRGESICCGGSLGSLTLGFSKREIITRASLKNLYSSNADAIATACPLCQTTLARYADRPVWDVAEIVDSLIKI